MTDLEQPEKTGVSRRTVAKAMAWAVPAIAIAAPAPAYAAASPIITVSQAGPACKLPGNSCANEGFNKGYLQALEICNNSTQSVTVSITTPAFLTINGEVKEFTPVPGSFQIDPDGCQIVVLNLNLQDNSEQSDIVGTLNWTFVAADQQTGSGTTPINTAVTPPCEDCTAPVD